MKNILNIKKLAYLLIIAVTFTSFASCNNNDDENDAITFTNLNETSDFYGANPKPDAMRSEFVGKWYDESGKLLLDVHEWRKNPNFPQSNPQGPYEPEYQYRMDSNIPEYVNGNVGNFWYGEKYIIKNNLSISPDMYILLEGKQAKLHIEYSSVNIKTINIIKK